MITHVQSTDLILYHFSTNLQFTATPLSGWLRIAALWSRDFRVSIEQSQRQKSFRLNEPSVFLLSSGGTLEVSGKGEGFFIEIRKDLCTRLIDNNFTRESPVPIRALPEDSDPPAVFEQNNTFSSAGNCPLYQAMQRFVVALSGKRTVDRGLRELYLTECFLLLSTWNRKETGDIVGSSTFGSIWSVKDLAAYIDTHYEDQFGLDELAGRCQLNPSYLSLCFKQEIGIPLFEYINQARIKKACSLLKNTKRPVTEIAFEVGYNNITFFNRYFKRITGMTPREYRR